MKSNLLAKIIGGICILGASYLIGYSHGSKNVSVDDGIQKYLSKIEQVLPEYASLKGGIKVLKSMRGRVVLSIDDKVKVYIMEGVNNVYDSNVDVVEIIGKNLELIRVYQAIDSHPPAEYVKKMTLEDQIMWNSIYNALVDKNSEISFTL